MMFRILVLSAFLFCCAPCSAQSGKSGRHRLPQTLLWRISGMDGHRVSYLYGTMHLTDERVFDLGDSLYAAIHNSEGFAMEIDPSYMTGFVIEEIEKQIKNTRNLRDVLTENDYRQYGPLLEKRLGKPLNKITSQDILRAKNKWIEESYHNGKMPTFLDTWLFDIARRQNKWTGGVEDPDDQKGLMDDVVDGSDVRDLVAEDHSGAPPGLQAMIGIYARQDLDGIDSMTGQGDTVLLRRNRKMAMRMDSLSGVRSMVFAVGAAHLPGEQGLISLLRKKGFAVEPVFSAHKTRAADYVVPELPVTWKDVADDGGLYRASMPGEPGNLEMYDLVQMKAYFDIFNGIAYLTTAFHSQFDADKNDSLMNAFAMNIIHKEDKKENAPFSLGDAKGRVFTGSGSDGYKKVVMVFRDGIFYVAMAMASKESAHTTVDIDKFVRSFKILDRKTSAPDSLVMVPFVDSALAYRVVTPAAAKRYENFPSREGIDSRAYMSYDMNSGNVFFFGVNTVKRGLFITNDSTYFSDMKKELAARFDSVSIDTSWYEQDRLVMEYGGRAKGIDRMMTARYITRGNRWYALVALYPLSGPTRNVRQFFSSFSLLDFPMHRWASFQAPDSTFRTWAPYPLKIDKHDPADGLDQRYYSFDSLHTMNYFVLTYHLKPWYWADSDSLFWGRAIGDYLGNDSLIYKKPVTNGLVKGWEWMQRPVGSRLYQRRRLLLDGDELYSLIVSGPHEEVTTADCDRFFSDLRLPRVPMPTSYWTPKADILLKNLYNKDSALAAKAMEYFSGLSWRAEDKELLERALLASPPADWKGDDGDVKDALVRKLISLKDSSVFDFAADSYKKTSDAVVKNRLLRLMAGQRDSVHFAAMADILRDSPPAGLLEWRYLVRLADSLQLGAVAVPRLLPLLKDSFVRPSILYPVARMIDSGMLALRELEPYRQDLMHYAAVRVQKVTGDEDNSGMNDDDLIRLLGHFNDGQSNALLRKFQKSGDRELRLMTVRRLLWNKQAVDASTVQSLAANRASRLRLYWYLKEEGRLLLFPPAFRTQKAFGESLVYQEIEDEDMKAGPISYWTVRSGQTKKGIRRFLFYTLKADSDDSLYLACVGPWEQDPARLSNGEVPVQIDFETPFSVSATEQKISALLKRAIEAADKKGDE